MNQSEKIRRLQDAARYTVEGTDEEQVFPQLTDVQFLLLLSKSLEKTMLVLTSGFVYHFLIIVPYFCLTKF